MLRPALAVLLAVTGVVAVLLGLEHQNRTLEQARRAQSLRSGSGGQRSTSGVTSATRDAPTPASEPDSASPIATAVGHPCPAAGGSTPIRWTPKRPGAAAQHVDLGGDGRAELVLGWRQPRTTPDATPGDWLLVLEEPDTAAPRSWRQLLRRRVQDHLVRLHPHPLKLASGASLVFYESLAGASSLSTGFVTQTPEGALVLGDLGPNYLQALLDLDGDGQDELLTSSTASYGVLYDSVQGADALRWSTAGPASLLDRPAFELLPLPGCARQGPLLLALRRQDPTAGGDDTLGVLRWSAATAALEQLSVTPIGPVDMDAQDDSGRLIVVDPAGDEPVRPLRVRVGGQTLLLDAEEQLEVEARR